MKIFITLIFAIFIFTSVHSQDVQKIKGGYLSGYAGGGILFDDAGIYLGAGLTGGYQWSPWVGFGGSWSSHIGMEFFATGFNGVSLQYRIRPNDRWSMSLDYGYILSHVQGTDGAVIEYIPGRYNFFKFHWNRKMGKAFTLGFNMTFLPKVDYLVCVDTFHPDNCPNPFVLTYNWSASGLLLTLGFIIE